MLFLPLPVSLKSIHQYSFKKMTIEPPKPLLLGACSPVFWALASSLFPFGRHLPGPVPACLQRLCIDRMGSPVLLLTFSCNLGTVSPSHCRDCCSPGHPCAAGPGGIHVPTSWQDLLPILLPRAAGLQLSPQAPFCADLL